MATLLSTLVTTATAKELIGALDAKGLKIDQQTGKIVPKDEVKK